MDLPVRLRRLRKNAQTRRLFAENTVDARQLVQPYFIVPGTNVNREVKPRLGLWQMSWDKLEPEVEALQKAGIGGVMLFGVPTLKSDDGSKLEEQLEPLTRAAQHLRQQFPDLVLFADVCLCSYTTHGHCGLVKGHQILNDETLPVLSQMAVLLAQAGVDWVSPSDMMDGRVRAIRSALDHAKLTQTAILAYAVKMASALYGPFRSAADSAPGFGDRTSYQMPAGNRREARREWQLDVEEGADALLFKPALTNLDLIRDAREGCDLPLVAYQVSGEYAMLRATADAGLLDFDRAINETLLSLKRAGADVLISYHARTVAGL
jgi:porphobilinogen synthase